MKEFKITERREILCYVSCVRGAWKTQQSCKKILNNKKILDNLRDGIPYPYTLADAKAFIQSMSEAEPDSTYAFAITADGRLAGSIGAFRKRKYSFRTAEIGYYIAEKDWGGELVLTLLSGSAAIFFKIQICFGSLPSPCL